MNFIWILGCVSLLYQALVAGLGCPSDEGFNIALANLRGRYIHSRGTYYRVPLQNFATKKPAPATHN